MPDPATPVGPEVQDPAPGRVVWLVTSPRVAPGVLSWPAWEMLRAADHVVVTDPSHPLRPAVESAGISVDPLPTADPVAHVLELARAGTSVVWLAGDEDGGLGERLGQTLATEAEAGVRPAELEILAGSYDLPGARLLDLVAVMDRLRVGCPWDREQTHRSLVRYLLEETYETIEALETGTSDDIREELGDLLLQIVFHARMAEEDPDAPWTIDDLVAELVEKLVRRHPHVFGDVDAADAEAVSVNWERLKAREKPRTSPLDGVPRALPALALADKVIGRLARAGTRVESAEVVGDRTAEGIGAALLALVAAARESGVDPEQALRDAVRGLIDQGQVEEAGDA